CDIYANALAGLGISLKVETVDNAQYVQRQNGFDFDLSRVRRDLSLSPGNEQRLYWGSDSAAQTGSRNIMGVTSPAIDSMIEEMLKAKTPEEFNSAVRALDRVLTQAQREESFFQKPTTDGSLPCSFEGLLRLHRMLKPMPKLMPQLIRFSNRHRSSFL
ncbi:ABC transporter, periplasmic substrate-binding protein, partial [Roseobacter sp. SK209-2-6]